MENHVKMTPKDFFMHLLGFFALYASVISFLTLVFQYINVIFPDKLNYYFTGILDTIRWSSSALLVVFLVFILVNWLIGKDFGKNPEKRDLKFRKWLIYFTLFASAVTIVVDLIRLVYNFYGGEILANFILKVAIVLLVAAGVFLYYFWDLKRTADKKYQLPKIIAIVTSIVVLSAIVAGFFVVGSPAVQRQRSFDDRRVNDLQVIQSQIINYWQMKQKLPVKLIDLNDSISGFVAPVDPETGAEYEYAVTSPLAFDLCAIFNIKNLGNAGDTAGNVPMPRSAIYPDNDPYSQNWSHSAGRVCFARTIDPQLYKLNPPIVK